MNKSDLLELSENCFSFPKLLGLRTFTLILAKFPQKHFYGTHCSEVNKQHLCGTVLRHNKFSFFILVNEY
jgi:hypothetical protein